MSHRQGPDMLPDLAFVNSPAFGGEPLDEYRCVNQLIRTCAVLRMCELALLVFTTAGVLAALALSSLVPIADPAGLKAGGLAATLAFLVVHDRSSARWDQLCRRANELSRVLGFRAFPQASRWSPVGASGAVFYLHLFAAALWAASLLPHFPRSA